MTAKEFVLHHEPNMRIESHRHRGPFGNRYYLCRIKGQTMPFSEGETASKCWNNAALKLAKIIVESKYPDAYNRLSLRDDKTYIFVGDEIISKHKNKVRAWILAAEKFALHYKNKRLAELEPEADVCIWSGEHGAYWLNLGGYTEDKSEAKTWKAKEAFEMISNCGIEKKLELVKP